MSWYTDYSKPDDFQMKNVGSSSWEEFVFHSEQITQEVHETLLEFLPAPLSDHRILDFGCGIGRVALKLWKDAGAPSHGCDINPDAIEYLGQQLPDVDLMVSTYEPPLVYEADFFDLLFSISIWTHLPPELQMPWLEEVHRILKPGGTALISISSASSMPIRKRRLDLWEKYDEEDLEREGILFVEYRYLQKTPEAYPGVTSSYGSTMHNFEFVKREWGKLFSSVEIRPKAIAKSQDLVILRK